MMKEKKTMRRKIQMGSRWIKPVNGETYILAQVGNRQCALVSLGDGNRWDEPVSVFDPMNISDDEWERISEGDSFVWLSNSPSRP